MQINYTEVIVGSLQILAIAVFLGLAITNAPKVYHRKSIGESQKQYTLGYDEGYNKVIYCHTVLELNPTEVDKVYNCRVYFKDHGIKMIVYKAPEGK